MEVQVVQDDYDHITLNVVFHDLTTPSFADWKEEIRKMMGNVTVDIKAVDNLIRLPGGKIIYTMCMIGKK